MNSQGRPLPPGHPHTHQYPVGGEYNLTPPAPYPTYPPAYPAPHMPMGSGYQPMIPPQPGFWDMPLDHYGGAMGDPMTATSTPDSNESREITYGFRSQQAPFYQAPVPRNNWNPLSWLEKNGQATAQPANDPPARQNDAPAVNPVGAVGFVSSGPGRVSFPDAAAIPAVPWRAGGYGSAGNGSVLGNTLAGPSNGNAPVRYPRQQCAAPAVNTAQPVGSGPGRRSESGRGALVEIDPNGSGRVSKRGRGRPKGSKNKPKPVAAAATAAITATTAAHTAGASDESGAKSRPPISPTANGGNSRPLMRSITTGVKSKTPTRPATTGGESRPPTGPIANGGKRRPPASPATNGGKSRSPTRPATKGGKTRPPTSPTANGTRSQPAAEPSKLTEWLRTLEDESLADLRDETPTECLSELGDGTPTEDLPTPEDEPRPAWLSIPATDPLHAERIWGPLEPSWIGRRESEYVLHSDHVRYHIPGLLPRSRNPSWAPPAQFEMLE